MLGKNGAGKSTLLKNLMGLLYPSSGGVSVNGFKPSGRKPSFLRTVYFIPEEVHVPALNISDYVALFAPFYPAFDRDLLNSYLDRLDVKTDDKLNKLSFGQQKKFIIGFALACNTSVLIMDEPTNGLDIPSKKRFRKLISSSMHEDRLIFISTHQTRDLENLIDQVIIVDNGELNCLSIHCSMDMGRQRTCCIESFTGKPIVDKFHFPFCTSCYTLGAFAV